MKGMRRENTEEIRKNERERISADVAAYLASGGKIDYRLPFEYGAAREMGTRQTGARKNNGKPKIKQALYIR